MSTTTTNLGLVKPEMTDAADITAMNGNWDKIDTNIQNSITHIASTNNPHGVTKSQVGLGNVNNTSDLDKPISTAVQTALDTKANTSALPNITKNPDSATGDIINTHLTIGEENTGNSDYGLLVGNKNSISSAKYACFILGGHNNSLASNFQYWDSGIIGGSDNSITATSINSANNDIILGGSYNSISGILSGSCIIGGNNNTVSGSNATILAGNNNEALAAQVKSGHYSKSGTKGGLNGTTGDAFIIGNGTKTAQSNCFRVDYAGNVYGLSSFKGTGADYAEYFEWFDGNPNGDDRRGVFVTLDGEKIKVATDTDDYILGVVSALPSICGDTQSEVWQGMYLKDVYGAYLTDDDGNMILNPEYDGKNEYISREHRKEWSAVGMLGKLIVRDDGTCQVNEYCEVSKNGVATSSETGYRVLSRIDETHVKILFR